MYEFTDHYGNLCQRLIAPTGVCRDLAHLGIALCRSLSIPARMVVGYYVLPIGANGPARLVRCLCGWPLVYLRRDAADVAIYNQFGLAVYPTAQAVHVERIQD